MPAIFGDILLSIHVIAGGSTLITGPMAIFYNFRYPGKHRIVGKVFFYAMLIVSISAILMFFKQPDKVFLQFLVGIALFVLAGILRGVRSIFLMKGGAVSWFDWAYTILICLNAIFMLGMSVWHIMAHTMIAFPILFGVFGFISATDTWVNWKTFSHPSSLHRFDWMRLHLSTMLTAFIASTTAFTVNAAPFLPWWAQWFGPTVLLVPLQIYFGRKVKAMHASAMRKI